MLSLSAILLFTTLQTPQVGPSPQLAKRLKAQYTMSEDVRKFFPRQVGMDTARRLDSYANRLKLESESPTQALNWRCVGPEVQSGRVVRIHENPKNAEEMYVAFATGGLWRTKDWGITWTSLFNGQSSFGIGDFTIAPNGKTIWLGTGEHNSQRTSYQGTGVFRSDDLGKTWRHMGLADANHIGAIVVNPKNDREVYVAALGHLYSANDTRGVYKSTDGGATWTRSLFINELTGVINLEIDPRNPNVLYAAAWERERRAWDFRDAGPSTAIYKTEDAGKTWHKLTSGLPSGDLGRIGIAIAPSKPDVVYAFIDNWNSDPDTIYDDEYAPSGTLTPWRFMFLNETQFAEIDKTVMERFVGRYLPQGTNAAELQADVKEKRKTLSDVADLMEKRNKDVFEMERVTHEIYRSDNAGKTWKRTHSYRFGVHGGYYFGEVRVNPKNADEVWTLGTILLRSRDGGHSWTSEAPGVHVDFHEVWIDPNNTDRLMIGCDGGPYLSGDDGKTFRHLNNLPVGQATTLAVDNKIPYNIYVGLQDNGTLVGPSTYNPGSSPVTAWKAIGGGDGSWIAVDPRNDGDLVYVASQWGAHNAYNQKTNERWGSAARNEPGVQLRYQWVSPLIISAFHPDILYLGSQMVHRSFNQGRNWTSISPDLTTNRPQGDVPYSTIKSLDESPFKFGVLVAGTDDGRVQLTKDEGTTWTDITPPVKKWVSRVYFSRFDAQTLFVCQSGYREDDYTPYVWRSKDMGKTWESIAGNLPLEFVNSIKEDPANKNRLFVATGMGVFMSWDSGATWEALGGALPHVAVHDIVIQPRDRELVAATHGRSAWVFDLKPLDKITPEIRKEPIHLFDLPSVFYSDSWTMPRTSTWSLKTPDGPSISSFIWLKTGGKLTMRLKTKEGAVIREQSADALPGLQPIKFFLQLKAQSDKFAIDPKKAPRQTTEQILADPFAGARPEFVKPGEYVFEVECGSAKVATPWKLSG